MINRHSIKGGGKFAFSQSSAKITDIIMLNDNGSSDITVSINILDSEGEVTSKIVKDLVVEAGKTVDALKDKDGKDLNVTFRQNEQIQIDTSATGLFTNISFFEELVALNYGIIKSRISYIGDGEETEFWTPEANRPLNDPSECLVFLEGIEQTKGVIWDLNDTREKVVFGTAPLDGLRIEIRTIK